MKQRLLDELPRWLLTCLVCLALEQGLGSFCKLDSRWWLAALVLPLCCVLLAAAERFGRFRAMLALWAAAAGLCLLLADRAQLSDAVRAALARSGESRSSGDLPLLLLSSAAALPLSALLRSRRVRLALSLGWIALWIAAALAEQPLPRTVPAAMIPLVLLSLSETIRRFRREPDADAAMTRMLLLSLLPAALLLAVLPVSAHPFDYPLLHSVADRIEQKWYQAESALRYRHGGTREFSLEFNGTASAAGAGDSLERERPGVIYAQPGHTTDGALYLFGNAWDRFDGRSWSSSLEPKDAELLNWKLDTAERAFALWRLLGENDGAAFSDYFRPNNVYLICRDLNVRTMFVPMNATHVFTDADRFPYADAPTGSLFDYVQRDEVWYRIDYLESNARTRGALISAAAGTVYEPEASGSLWRWVAQDFERYFRLDLSDDVNLERLLARRAARIRSVYLDDSLVSERARALAEMITADCADDYEKVSAIAAFLQEKYDYTPSPGQVPEDVDFLDWLLFEVREGYCSWYATAAVLLSRSVGVPARYVQGYRSELVGEIFTPLGPGDAHAWCECYLDGYGWVTLEATPGFKNDEEGWLTADEEREHLTDPGKDATDAAQTQPGGVMGSNADPLPTPPARDETEPEAETPAAEEQSAAPRRLWLLLLIPVALPAVLLAIRFWQQRRRARRYAAADPSTQLKMDLELLLCDLRGKGYPRRPEESLQQYFARVPWHYLLADEAEAREMAALYDRCFFSPAAPSEEELARHRAFAARFRPRTLRQWMLWYSLQ